MAPPGAGGCIRGVQLSPNTLSVHWRIALGAAQDALNAGASYPGAGPLAAELRSRRTRLARERDEVQRLLERDARVEHVALLRQLSFPHVRRAELGLPQEIEACVFELDGVLTPSADLHYAAWATALAEYVIRRADYEEHLHGRPRLDGLRSFLASRGLTPPEKTVAELAAAKDRALRALLARQGIDAYAGATHYLEALAGSGLGCAVVSASENTTRILQRAELEDLVDVVVGGWTAPELIVAACEQLDVPPASVAAFETTSDGVKAARAVGAGYVVGVAGPPGADRVVGDLGELLAA